MVDYTIKLKSGHFFISPFAFLWYATDFLKAFQAYKPEYPFSPVSFYLVCRSIELAFKAYLLTKGVTINIIRKKPFSHDLEFILCEVKKRNIEEVIHISEVDEEEITQANKWYKNKRFEYFDLQNLVDGKETLPRTNLLGILAEKLTTELKTICINAGQSS
jgi:hypothetical protein